MAHAGAADERGEGRRVVSALGALRALLPGAAPREETDPDPLIEVTAVEWIEGLSAKDQATIAAHQWKIDTWRRREPEGRWMWESWPLGARNVYGQVERPCGCARHFEARDGGSLNHSPKIEHLETLAPEEQDALARYLRERDAAEPANWKILRRWFRREGGNYACYYLIDKDRDPPIWWDRDAFVESRRARFEHDEAVERAAPDAAHAKSAASTHRYACERYEEWLAKKAQLPIEEAMLAAMPEEPEGSPRWVDGLGGSFGTARHHQAQRVAMLRHEIDRPGDELHDPHGPPRLHTAAEQRAERLADVAEGRAGVAEEVEKAEKRLAKLTPMLRELLASLKPENW